MVWRIQFGVFGYLAFDGQARHKEKDEPHEGEQRAAMVLPEARTKMKSTRRGICKLYVRATEESIPL